MSDIFIDFYRVSNGGACVIRDDCIEGDCDEEEEDALISGGSSGEGGCKTAAATICMGFYGDGGIHDRLGQDSWRYYCNLTLTKDVCLSSMCPTLAGALC